MQYELLGFSQAKTVELGLCVADLVILRWFVNFMGTDKMTKKVIDGKDYYWIKYDGVLSDLPILHITKDTLYRRLKELVAKDVLEHVTVKEAGTYSLYRLGKNYLAMITDNLSENNPRGYGKKSVGGTEKNPEQNIHILKNTNKSLNSNEFKERSPKKTPNYNTVLSASENEYIKEALVKWIKACKDRGIGFQYKTLERWASTLRENAGDDPAVALAIVNQSIDAGWKNLYKLKRKPNTGPKISCERFDPTRDKLAVDENGNPIVF